MWNKCFILLPALLLMWISASISHAQSLPFVLPEGAGSFRLGISHEAKSCWLDQCRIKRKGANYIIDNPLGNGGEIQLRVCSLSASKGFILRATGKNLPAETQLFWAFGACNDLSDAPQKDLSFSATDCKDNVFVTEGQSFTVYYGRIMQLKTTQGVVSVPSELRLCDAHKQDSPIDLFHSGKKTDAPILAAKCPWINEQPIYFCLYKQNAQADYNAHILSTLFANELKK